MCVLMCGSAPPLSSGLLCARSEPQIQYKSVSQSVLVNHTRPGEFSIRAHFHLRTQAGPWQVSFLGIRNRGNRNNGFYSWDYVDLGLNSAHATKNSGLRPLGLNSEIKTSIATFDEKKLILGIDTGMGSSNFCERSQPAVACQR